MDANGTPVPPVFEPPVVDAPPTNKKRFQLQKAKPQMIAYSDIPQFRATFGYKVCNIVVFLGLAVAVVAMELGWFTPLGLSYQDFLFNLNPTILTPIFWSYYIFLGIWGLQAIALFDLFLLTSFGHVHNKKKGKVLHAVDHWWIMGWLCEIGWILTIQYNTLGSFWAGFGFWTGTFVCFGMSALRLNAFRGWFNLWYWIVYLGSASVNAAWAAIMTMVAVLTIMGQYNTSMGLQQGIGYGLLALYAVIAMFLVLVWRDFFFAGTMIFAYIVIWLRNNNRDTAIACWVMVGVLGIVVAIGLLLVCVLDAPRAMRKRKTEKAIDDATTELVQTDATAAVRDAEEPVDIEAGDVKPKDDDIVSAKDERASPSSFRSTKSGKSGKSFNMSFKSAKHEFDGDVSE